MNGDIWLKYFKNCVLEKNAEMHLYEHYGKSASMETPTGIEHYKDTQSTLTTSLINVEI